MPTLMRMNISVSEVLSPTRSCLVLPCFKTTVTSYRVGSLWTQSNPGSQRGILTLKVFLFLGQRRPASPTYSSFSQLCPKLILVLT